MAKSLNASCNVLLELLRNRTSEEGCGECLVGRIFIGVFFKRGSDGFLLSRLLGSLDFVFFCGQSGISSFVVVFLFAQP